MVSGRGSEEGLGWFEVGELSFREEFGEAVVCDGDAACGSDEEGAVHGEFADNFRWCLRGAFVPVEFDGWLICGGGKFERRDHPLGGAVRVWRGAF